MGKNVSVETQGNADSSARWRSLRMTSFFRWCGKAGGGSPPLRNGTIGYVGAAIGRQQMQQRVKEDSGRRIAAPTVVIEGAAKQAADRRPYDGNRWSGRWTGGDGGTK